MQLHIRGQQVHVLDVVSDETIENVKVSLS